jgi:hypothetical protein
LNKEFARHEDTENAIPAGDAFSFAELHYKQSGEELLQTLNKELNLRIGKQHDFYCLKFAVEKSGLKIYFCCMKVRI